ncbi:S26 family signal peptidase [Streptomyces sp. NPDC058953]|uniref:S26 family signal peptidase n=1 Tax=unclassified Streptomyces TaxID=2593676 RepID=UPI0036C0DF79
MWWLTTTGLVLVGALWRVRRTFTHVTVVGQSMTPALPEGTRVLLRRVPPDQLATGDIVVLPEPDSGQLIVKRIAAIGGESTPAGINAGAVVPYGMVAVLGDNPAWSHDSRDFGYVPTRRIRGRVERRLT